MKHPEVKFIGAVLVLLIVGWLLWTARWHYEQVDGRLLRVDRVTSTVEWYNYHLDRWQTW